MNCNCLYAEFAAGPEYPKGNLAPISDEYLVKHLLFDRHKGSTIFNRIAIFYMDADDLAR